MSVLDDIARGNEAARTFTHRLGSMQFTLRAPPPRLLSERLRASQEGDLLDALARAETQSAVTAWTGVTLGDFRLDDDPTPVEYSPENVQRLFDERPDVMAALGAALAEFVARRIARMEELRKNWTSTSSAS